MSSNSLVVAAPSGASDGFAMQPRRRRRRAVLTSEQLHARQQFFEEFQETAEATSGVATAGKMMSGDTFPLPLLVFSARDTKKGDGRMITAMIAPFEYFEKLGVKGYEYNTAKGRNEMTIIQDIRTADKRTADKANGVDIESYEIMEMRDLDEKRDPKGIYGRARRVITEGDVVCLYFGKTKEQEGNIDAGVLSVVNCGISCYHKTKNPAEYGLISVFEKIDSVRMGIPLPLGFLSDWLIDRGLTTQQFRTAVPQLQAMIAELGNNISEDIVKNLSYKIPNFVIIPLGLPQDANHPNIGRADSNILVNIPSGKEASFLREDKKSKETPKPMLPTLVFAIKGYQWKGLHPSAQFGDDDIVFLIKMTIYDRALKQFRITSPDAWAALMAPVIDLLEGVIVAKEDTNSGLRIDGNSNRIAELGMGATLEEIDAHLNGPVGKNEPSFVLSLMPEAIIASPVRFVQRVGFRVTSSRLKSYWNNTLTPKKEDYVTAPVKPDFGSPLICLTEAVGHNLDMIFAQETNYEFRVLTNVRPSALSVEKSGKASIYDDISDMSPDDGDQFLDFIIRGVGAKKSIRFLKGAGAKIPKTNPCHQFEFVLSEGSSLVIYIFAINLLQVNSQYKGASAQLEAANLGQLITGEAPPSTQLALPAPEPTSLPASPSKKQARRAAMTPPTRASKRLKTLDGSPAKSPEYKNPDEMDIEDDDEEDESGDGESGEDSGEDSSDEESEHAT